HTLRRTYISNGGQDTYVDQHFNLSGVTYSTSPNIGTENSNFYRTRFGYDAKGRQNYVKLPTGTIQRTVYDTRDRVLSNWMGTNDNGATDTDPTAGGAIA